MMIFAGLSEMTLNRVLAGLRAQQIRIPYKAILTSTNQHWTPEECFIEIKKEHEQMHGLNNLFCRPFLDRNSRFEPQKHSNRLFLSLLIDLYNKYSISPFPSDQLNSSSSTYFSFE